MASKWRHERKCMFYSWENGIILGEDLIDKYEFVEKKDENISNRWY